MARKACTLECRTSDDRCLTLTYSSRFALGVVLLPKQAKKKECKKRPFGLKVIVGEVNKSTADQENCVFPVDHHGGTVSQVSVSRSSTRSSLRNDGLYHFKTTQTKPVSAALLQTNMCYTSCSQLPPYSAQISLSQRRDQDLGVEELLRMKQRGARTWLEKSCGTCVEYKTLQALASFPSS